MSVILTEIAAKEVLQIMKDKELDPETHFLRVGVAGGGCSGFSYTLDITEVKSDLDEEWECDGVKIVCDAKSNLYLDGTKVDFKDELMGRGFVFVNPNATSVCGCGSSFSA